MNGQPPAASARKSVIVTGGASGLGLAMTNHFASQGHYVAILDVNTEAGAQVVSELAKQHPKAALSFKKCDISSWAKQAAVFKEVYAEHGGIDVVMANAGISEQGVSSVAGLGEEEEEPLEPNLKVLDVNLTGTIYTVKLAVHYLRKNKPDPVTGLRGSIICTSSNAGLYPFPVAPLYATSKFGVVGLVRSLAPVIGRVQVQINALAPAVLETNIAPSKELFKDMIVTPKTTLIKGVVLFLEKDPRLTGQVAEIHGESATIRPQHEYVDEDSRKNLEVFWGLGYA
ncbi:putative short chain dehydrogenase/reductase [Xylariaceae sp. FL0016]|nr:putative short chain dehydrogenase/reductase [Xylariaceae sp. FL0016]